MLLTRITLLAYVFVTLSVQRNSAWTKVLYQIHLHEAHTERNETGAIKDTDAQQPELLVTGARKTHIVFVSKNKTETIYKESTVYTADSGGYKARYNFSIRQPAALEPRLSGQALKVITG